MAFDTTTTVLLEKQYLYVRASKGFILEGMSTERIWTNTGYYRFLTDNVAKTLGNSYINIIHDSTDIDFIAYCSDLFLEELQNSVTVAVENLESELSNFAETNHEDITTLSTGLDGALETINTNIVGVKMVLSSDLFKFEKPVLSFSPTSSVVTCNLSSYSWAGALEVGDSVCISVSCNYNANSFNWNSVFNTGIQLIGINTKSFLVVSSSGDVISVVNTSSHYLYGDNLVKIVRVA